MDFLWYMFGKTSCSIFKFVENQSLCFLVAKLMWSEYQQWHFTK